MTMAESAPADPRPAMLFRDYVKELPHQWIFDNLMPGADKSRRILSSAMIKEAVAKFTANAALTKRFKELPRDLQVKCAQIYLMGKNGLTADDPAAYAKEPLLVSLLVYAAQAQNTNWPAGANNAIVKLFGFDEFEPILRPIMAETLISEASADPGGGQPTGCAWRPLNDVAAVCSLAFHRQLKRSIHGGLSRAALNALKKLTHDPTLTGKGVAESGSSAGHPAGFLIGYCLDESLIIDTEQEFLLNRQKFAAWLDKSMKERLNKLTEHAAEYLGRFGLELARETLVYGVGRRISADALAPAADQATLARALHVLEFLGCLHIEKSGDGMFFTPLQWTDCDVDLVHEREQKRDTLIMSDFSVVIPQEISPSELFDFAKIGMPAAFDKVYKGKITKESVSNSLSAGISDAYMREWLAARNASANVAKTVDEWIREFSRLFVNHGSVLVSSGEKITKQLSSFEPLRKYLTAIDAHTVFAIQPGSEQAVLDILEKLGFDARAPWGHEILPAPADNAEPQSCPHCESEHEQSESDDDDTHTDKRERLPIEWEPLTDFAAADAPPSAMNRTKYGAGLKALGISEIVQVADYAILTNQNLVIDYLGSAQIKQGVYIVTPFGVDKSIDSAIEAEIPHVRGRKLFLLGKIKRIGVVKA